MWTVGGKTVCQFNVCAAVASISHHSAVPVCTLSIIHHRLCLRCCHWPNYRVVAEQRCWMKKQSLTKFIPFSLDHKASSSGGDTLRCSPWSCLDRDFSHIFEQRWSGDTWHEHWVTACISSVLTSKQCGIPRRSISPLPWLGCLLCSLSTLLFDDSDQMEDAASVERHHYRQLQCCTSLF